ncbi:MAG TPA: hypothetical protein VGL19_10750 [Polyangiaceae bacterium]
MVSSEVLASDGAVSNEASVALDSPAAAARYGLWIDESRGVGGVARARMADGSMALALSHARSLLDAERLALAEYLGLL